MSTHINLEESFRQRFVSILLLALIFYFNFLVRFIWGPLLVDIEKDLGLSHAGAGALFAYISVGYFIGVFSSGYLSSWVTHKKTIVISSLSCGAALIGVNWAASPLLFKLMLMIIGLTSGFYLPSGIASLTYHLAVRDFGKAFAVHEIAPSLGFITGPLLCEILLLDGDWRAVLWPAAAGLVVFGLIYSFRNSTGSYRGEAPTPDKMQAIVSRAAFWVMLLLFIMNIGANVGVYSMMPLYLCTARGMDQTVVNLLLAASRFAAIISSLGAGWATAKFGTRPVILIFVLLSGLGTALLGWCPDRLVWLPVMLQPILAVGFFPPGFAILSAMVPAGLRNLIVSLTIPFAMLVGSGVFSIVLGAFGDAGHFHDGFVLVGLSITVSAPLILTVRPTEV